MPKIVELRQDRSHILNNFDGYKLSLDPVPLFRQEIQIPPNHATLGEDQYSLLHVELFAMQNLLCSDPWARNTVYFVNKQNEIVRCSYDENVGRPESMQVVYRCNSDGEERLRKDYNYSMRFISEKFCVVCDGIRQLFLLDTGDRLKPTDWKVVAKHRLDERNCMLYDCRLDTIQAEKQISLALGRVVSTCSNDGTTTHHMHLDWAKWIHKDAWIFSIVESLEGKGSLYYCAFEPRAESLIISSNREYKFSSQISNDAEIEQEEAPKKQLHGEENDIERNFSWTQTDEDIIVKLENKLAKSKSDYDIKCTMKNLNVKCGATTLLEFELYDKVDADLFTWSMNDSNLEITLVKQTSNMHWPAIQANGGGPKESGNTPINQEPIANLEAPIEDCDFPMGATDHETKIERFHLPTKSTTHAVILGSAPPLFATNLRPGFPLAIVTRQDVDACIWLQQYNPTKPDEWSMRHEGNLHAFGYIQASKQQRKYMDCSPDLSYVVICESHRHVFLYKAQYDTASGLRNRNGPQVTLGKQHLINLSDSEEVLGMATSPNVIMLLTATNILFLQIC